MRKATKTSRGSQLRTTWLELVAAVRDAAASDAEAVAVLAHWLRHGRVYTPARVRGRTPCRSDERRWPSCV